MEKQKTREEKVMNLRILELDKLIREEHYPSTAFLCRKLEVSRSTIMRDIEFLVDKYIDGGGNVFYQQSGGGCADFFCNIIMEVLNVGFTDMADGTFHDTFFPVSPGCGVFLPLIECEMQG